MNAPPLAERQVEAVQAVLTWLANIISSPAVEQDRREGVRRIVHLVNLAIEDPDGALERYR